MKRLLTILLTAGTALVAGLAAILVSGSPAMAASLTRVTNFGTNPTNLNMYIYVPANLAPRPALLVLVHYCSGSASAVFNGNGHDYVTAADRYGYIMVLPEATRSGGCFDVSTAAGLRRNGGSDSTGVKSMVDYARSQYPAIDPTRIVVSGFSSGAMMTNVLAAQYPDVFSAGSAFSGVPAGCFATSDGSMWNSQCSGGTVIRTAQQWGDTARAMYPGYTGAYPRMQLWHGTTDTTLSYPNFGEEIKQWTNLHGLSQTPAYTDHPQSTWTRTRYGATGTQATVEGISISGVGHQLPMSGQIAYAVSFLGLDQPSTPPTSTPPPTGGATEIVGTQSGRCVDVPNSSRTNGTRVQLYDCHGQANQRWTYTASKQLQVYGSMCLNAAGSGNASAVQIYACNGQSNQQWNVNTNGTVTGVQSGRCLDVWGTGNGQQVQIYDCNGKPNQQFTLRP
ncbi:extracellular catalytic domain type 1 short-chain-length polyhydroxyalkanoate depolymerase [Paractinoplanes atraurantiacus]|uniref:Esterase, PHB depolymerase family n=1 Tax=Paractinoplanes atraurantiacus TaxID=1036182 RepID=A0A285JIU4_9ACTN|nr:PHB depolymerase family esterase [Actinoplanes atraurantiacus]SNY59011.1 esterase, PHB depolymerase family [Actinoplanes atraurantiacus]